MPCRERKHCSCIQEACAAQVLAQHEQLRALLFEALDQTGRCLQGQRELARLALLVLQVRRRFRAHLAFEERKLFPILAQVDAWGPERVAELTLEHARQREPAGHAGPGNARGLGRGARGRGAAQPGDRPVARHGRGGAGLRERAAAGRRDRQRRRPRPDSRLDRRHQLGQRPAAFEREPLILRQLIRGHELVLQLVQHALVGVGLAGAG